MLTDLLDELAREAPTGGAPPGQLWRRGRRMARTQRLGTTAIAVAACLLLIALGSVTWQQRSEMAPAADTGGATYLPSRFHEPDPHLRGTDAVGPIGPLVAVRDRVQRAGWFGTAEGLVGVSAESGAYAFLDLPRAASRHLHEAALSPDGRHVAYWTTGGYAVYDTVTGGVVATSPRTEHESTPGVLVWFDTTHLGVAFEQMQSGSRSVVLDLDSGRTTDLDTSLAAGADDPGASTNGTGTVIVQRKESVVIEADGTTAPASIPATGPLVGGAQPLALTPDAERLAAIVGGSAPAPIHVKEVGEDGDGDPVPGRYAGVVAWLDADHVAALTQASDGLDLVSLDVRDGSSELLSSGVGGVQVALDLLGSPVKDQPAPPRPWSPWVPTLAAGGTIAVAALAILVWRRRARG